MIRIRADLHVHTVLSPCAEVEMIPPLIVQQALELGIQLIAITDHNGTANIEAVQKAAEGTGLAVLPGMEVQTVEEVHVLCLFDTLDQAHQWQQLVDHSLPDIPNRPDFFGEQFVVDSTGDFLRNEERLLLTSVQMSLEEAWQQIDRLGGLFIPAHINRTVNGMISNLGFIPTNIPFPGLEISRQINPSQAVLKYPQIVRYPLIQSGDVHRLSEFLGSTYFELAAVSIKEIRKALQKIDGRSVEIKPQ